MALRLLSVLAFVSLGCGRVDVNTAGLPCPCSDGNECDEVCNVCVTPGTPEGLVCSDCKILFRDFHADWVTPNSIGWRWTNVGSAADAFGSYALELTADGETPRVYDSGDNPELALYTLPNSGADPVEATITDGLTPGAVYKGTLTATDNLNCKFSSTNISRATIQPQGVAIELFGEGTTTGFIAGQDGSVVNTDCYEGVSCLHTATPACTPEGNDPTCGTQLKYAGLDIAVDEAALAKGEFPDAYLEVYTKNTAPSPSYYSWIWLRTLKEDVIWEYAGFTLPNEQPSYKRVQIPLNQLVRKGTSVRLTREDLAANGIREFNLGTIIDPSGDAAVLADEAFIRR